MNCRARCVVVGALMFAVGVSAWSPQAKALYGTDMPYGERVTDGRFPAVVRVWFPGIMGCQGTGVLITPRHILTAAHIAPTEVDTTGRRYVEDSSWYESRGRDANEARDVRFSFVNLYSEGSEPRYQANEFWVHPSYDPDLGDVATWDLMILVADEEVEGIEPVPVMPRRNADHLQRGAWVRHVSWGPTEGCAMFVRKSTVLTRTLSVGANTVTTWGRATNGDSGCPVFQQRFDDYGRIHEVLVGILSSRGINSTWINEMVYSWIRDIVDRTDPSLLPNDYDRDGVDNMEDNCLLTLSSRTESDEDGDGVGEICDFCDLTPNGGQFDTDADGAFNGCDPCPFYSSILTFDELAIRSSYYPGGYWTQNPVAFEVRGVQSDGRWLDEEYTTSVTIESRTRILDGLTPALTLPEGRHTAQVRIRDGCGIRSSLRSIEFGVDDTDPSVYFASPDDGAMMLLYRYDDPLTVEVAVGDMLSGVSSVELWLDNPGSDEFNPGRKLCDFRGPWIRGFMSRDSCTVRASRFLYGEHTYYAVARDSAGNEQTASRTINVVPVWF